jgi:thioredoxin-dependent peroxiredoxin
VASEEVFQGGYQQPITRIRREQTSECRRNLCKTALFRQTLPSGAGSTALTSQSIHFAASEESCAPFVQRVICTLGMLKELKEGDSAPEISLKTDAGEPFRLSSLKGKNIVLYFYPKADTPGCTKEACEFRDNSKKFAKANTEIIGVSPDSDAAQARFKTKFDLPFTLLADNEHKAAETYGVWKEKSMYGRKYMGVERTTFVIDHNGKIKKIFPKVKVDGHAEEVLSALD